MVTKCLHAACFCALLLAACSESAKKLDAISGTDRIVIGEFEKPDARSEIRDPSAKLRALSFANELRKGAWSSQKAVHGSCGTYLLTFQLQGKVTGYLGLDGDRFFTNGPEGELQQPATPERVAAFMTLLPLRYEPTKCVG